MKMRMKKEKKMMAMPIRNFSMPSKSLKGKILQLCKHLLRHIH